MILQVQFPISCVNERSGIVFVAERHQPGVYRVGWDGTDSEGRPVASGIYFYQMWAGEIIDVKKMLLLK